jgi:hypothetical protein
MCLGQWDPDTVPVEEFYASAYVLMELVAREVKTQIAGITVVNDVSGFGFKHIRLTLKTFIQLIRENILF